MTRLAIALTTIGLSAGGLAPVALAHPGHLATAGGHDHWELLGGIAVLALAVGVAAWARFRA